MYSEIKFFKNYFTKISDNFFILDNDDSYSVNFGKQWRDHRDIQIDSINKFSLSYDVIAIKSVLIRSIFTVSGYFFFTLKK